MICLLRNLYAGQEATVRTGHGTTDWFQIGKGVHQGCTLSPCLFNFYACLMGIHCSQNTPLEKIHPFCKWARGLRIRHSQLEWQPTGDDRWGVGCTDFWGKDSSWYTFAFFLAFFDLFLVLLRLLEITPFLLQLLLETFGGSQVPTLLSGQAELWGQTITNCWFWWQYFRRILGGAPALTLPCISAAVSNVGAFIF